MSLREPAVTTPSSPTAPDRRIDFGRMSRRAWIVTGLLVLFQIIAFADKAVLDLWHWQDARLQPQQRLEAAPDAAAPAGTPGRTPAAPPASPRRHAARSHHLRRSTG